MAASVKQPKLTEAHGPGSRACISWDVQGKALVTAGADARLLVHSFNGSDEPVPANVLHQKAVTALCMAPGGHTLASASLDRTVKLYTYPGATFEGNITRFTLPIRSLAFSITGGLLAAAGDDDEIKLISTVDNSIVRVLKGHDAPVVSLAFDPKNDILASADSDGTVIYWALASGAKLHSLKHAAPDVDVEEAGRNEIAWHPSGDVVAVPGHQFDVAMYDRDTAEVRFRLRGGHNTAIGCLAWSPNGKYLATTGQDRKVMLWDTESKQDLDRLKVVSQVTAISWKPTGNALAMIDVDGKFGVWEDAIPSHLASPSDLQQALAALSRQELLRFTDNDVSDKENSGSGDEGSEDLRYAGEEDSLEDDDDDEDEGEGDSPKVKKEFKKSKKPSKESKLLREVSQLKGTLSPPRAKKVTSKSHAEEKPTIPRHPPCAHKPRPEKQSPFQPGSTRQKAGVRRFLAYNMLGCITSFESEGVSHVEVEFHDTSRGHRMPAMTDFNGFTMAALSDRGSVLANPQRGDKTPSTLVYRPCNSWATNSEWSMRFPLNEEVKAVAVGDQWVAAATNLNYLRIYSETGLQRSVICLTGPVVTMTSHQQLLAIVTHVSDPLECGQQVMEFMVLDVRNHQRLLMGPLPVTPGAELTWLGFSESGALSSYDSKGVLRMFSRWYGGCWVPVFSVSTEQESRGEKLWMVGLDSTQIFCVKCKAPDLQPQVNPKPILSMVSFSMPLAQSDLGAADLENNLLCQSLFLAETRSKADEAAVSGQEDDSEEDQLLKMEAELDRCLLRLMTAACQGDKLARALELASMLSLHRSLEGAIKIVSAMHLSSLAERLNTMLEGRRKLEKSAAAVQMFQGRTAIKQRAIPAESSTLRVHSSAQLPLPSRNSPPVVPPTKGPAVHPASELVDPPPEVTGSPQPLERSRVMNGTGVRDTENHGLQNLKSPQSHQPVKQSGFTGTDTNTPLSKPLASSLDITPMSKTSNPFAKSSISSDKSSLTKQDGIASGSEVSVLDSLKKMQKAGTEMDGKKKRKAKSSAVKSVKPSKAAKEAS